MWVQVPYDPASTGKADPQDRPILIVPDQNLGAWVSPPHTPSPLHVQCQLNLAASKAIS